MERAYYLDLGFPIDMSGRKTEVPARARETTLEVGDSDRLLLHALEDGLAITPRPYAELGQRCEATEDQVIARLARLLASGIISRLGVIVRHRALGIAANAMAVWDIDDDKVNDVGAAFAAVPFVTLCYRRPRRLPSWRYNLFTMIHGRDRATVEAQVAELAAHTSIGPEHRAVLFSKRCFTQRGARYKAA
jgi:DNA-binding Lrp family transcriptional regulator